MKLFMSTLTLLLCVAAQALPPHEEITPLQLGQATLASVQSLIRKEKITADKIQVISVNPEYLDSTSNEELLEIKTSYISTAGPTKIARFLCHAVEHASYEAAVPHCHRAE